MSVGSVLTFLGSFFGLAKLILTEIFERKKAARLKNEQYELDKAQMLLISQQCLDKMRSDLIQEQKQAQDIEDQLDAHERKNNP